MHNVVQLHSTLSLPLAHSVACDPVAAPSLLCSPSIPDKIAAACAEWCATYPICGNLLAGVCCVLTSADVQCWAVCCGIPSLACCDVLVALTCVACNRQCLVDACGVLEVKIFLDALCDLVVEAAFRATVVCVCTMDGAVMFLISNS
jgi:hypothetical protein